MVEIRRTGPDDLGALYALIHTLGFKKEDGYFERCLKEQEEGRRDVLVARLDGADVAYAMLYWNSPYALYRRLGIPEIQDLNTVPAARRQGAGSALIEHCENIAREKGCDMIGIGVGLYSDYGAAQRLYVKRGYVPDGYGVCYDRAPVTPGEIRPVDDDLCLMMVKTL